MNKKKVLYAITVEDVIDVSKQKNISVKEADIFFISEKMGDYLGDKWQDAVEYALESLKNK